MLVDLCIELDNLLHFKKENYVFWLHIPYILDLLLHFFKSIIHSISKKKTLEIHPQALVHMKLGGGQTSPHPFHCTI